MRQANDRKGVLPVIKAGISTILIIPVVIEKSPACRKITLPVALPGSVIFFSKFSGLFFTESSDRGTFIEIIKFGKEKEESLCWLW